MTTDYRTLYLCASFFYHDIPASGSVAGVAQGADLGRGLVFKVQLHILNAHVASPWEQDSKKEEEEKRQTHGASLACRLALPLSYTLRAKSQSAHKHQQQLYLFTILTLDIHFKLQSFVAL